MALTETTLAAAVAVDDNVITVAASTSLSAGYFIRVDDEDMKIAQSYTIAGNGVNVPVLRGQLGSKTAAHASGAYALHGPAADFASGNAANTTPYNLAGRTRRIASYSSSTAVTLPSPGEDLVVVFNGTSAKDLTIADPSKDMTGTIIFFCAGGAAAWTITAAGGFGAGGSSYDKLTFAAGAQVCVMAIAVHGAWCVPSAPAFGGTATNLVATIS